MNGTETKGINIFNLSPFSIRHFQVATGRLTWDNLLLKFPDCATRWRTEVR